MAGAAHSCGWRNLLTSRQIKKQRVSMSVLNWLFISFFFSFYSAYDSKAYRIVPSTYGVALLVSFASLIDTPMVYIIEEFVNRVGAGK